MWKSGKLLSDWSLHGWLCLIQTELCWILYRQRFKTFLSHWCSKHHTMSYSDAVQWRGCKLLCFCPCFCYYNVQRKVWHFSVYLPYSFYFWVAFYFCFTTGISQHLLSYIQVEMGISGRLIKCWARWMVIILKSQLRFQLDCYVWYHYWLCLDPGSFKVRDDFFFFF